MGPHGKEEKSGREDEAAHADGEAGEVQTEAPRGRGEH